MCSRSHRSQVSFTAFASAMPSRAGSSPLSSRFCRRMCDSKTIAGDPLVTVPWRDVFPRTSTPRRVGESQSRSRSQRCDTAVKFHVLRRFLSPWVPGNGELPTMIGSNQPAACAVSSVTARLRAANRRASRCVVQRPTPQSSARSRDARITERCHRRIGKHGRRPSAARLGASACVVRPWRAGAARSESPAVTPGAASQVTAARAEQPNSPTSRRKRPRTNQPHDRVFDGFPRFSASGSIAYGGLDKAGASRFPPGHAVQRRGRIA